MTPALIIVGLLALISFAFSALVYRAGRNTDDFGSAAVFSLLILAGIVLLIIWAVLAAIHWWPR